MLELNIPAVRSRGINWSSPTETEKALKWSAAQLLKQDPSNEFKKHLNARVNPRGSAEVELLFSKPK